MPRTERLVFVLVLALVAGHLLVNVITPYGIHRDELLYLSMGTHLSLWRMDFPPMIALLANLERALAGDSLVSIRLLPAVTGGLLTWIAALVARRLGGGRAAQLLAATCVVASPLFLRAASLFQPVIFDQLWWSLALLVLLWIGELDPAGVAPGTQRRWLVLGAVMGLGLLTKFSIAFIGVAIAVALLATPMRRALATPWPWLAVLVAVAIGSPSITGQVLLGFPVVGQMHDLRSSQLVHVATTDFVLQQLLFGPQTLVAAWGAVWLMRAPEARHARAVGLSAIAAFALLLLLRGKAYYIGPIYPVLFGAGAVALVQAAERRSWRILVPLTAAVCVAYGALLFPVGVPVLAPVALERYVHAVGLTPALRSNRGTLERLPQDYADMLPWQHQAAAVARVFGSLSAEERAKAVIGADNYGEAGALDFYGPRLGLPPVISGAGSFWYFGPGTRRGDVAIVLGGTADDLRELFDSVVEAGMVREPYGVEEEREVSIFVARRPKVSLQEAWPGIRP